MSEQENQPTLDSPPVIPGGEQTLGWDGTGPEPGLAADSYTRIRVPGYEIQGELGRGGMGVVYKARQTALNREVALKMVLAGGHATATQLLRFRQEAETVARLEHPNIVRVFEVGSHEGNAYLCLEYVGGGTLAGKTAGLPQNIQETARLVESLAHAVHHAHSRNVVHRDLKPSNVLLTPDGAPKIADFGLARSIGEESGLTLSNAVLGTPGYMAPEQAEGRKDVGPVADTYALGAILYELLTGRPPHQGATIPETLRRVVSEEPVAVRRRRSDCPRDLETVCLKCLQKDPHRRYATAADLADDLHRYLADEPVNARPIGFGERFIRWARRNPGIAFLVGLTASLLAIIAIGGVGFSFRLGAALDQARNDRSQAELDRDAARRAEREGRERLYQSLISEAQALRYSHRIGQRFGTLDAIRRAVALARELEKPPEAFAELRNMAIVALALPDLQPTTEWMSEPDEPEWVSNHWTLDPNLRWQAFSAKQTGAVSLRRVGASPADSSEIARLPGFGGGVLIEPSPDGRFLAVTHWERGGRLQIWKADVSPPSLALDVPSGCQGVAFGYDDRLFTTHRDGRLRVSDLRTGKEIQSLPDPSRGATWMACHPRLPLLALSTLSGAIVINLDTEKMIAQMPGPVSSLAWHPDGELIALGTSTSVEVWDAVRNRRHWSHEHRGGGLGVTFNGHGDLLMSYGWANRTRFWNPYTGQEVFGTVGTPSTRFGLDNRFLFGNRTAEPLKTQPLTQITRGEEYRTLVAGIGQPQLARDYLTVRIHPGGRLAAVATRSGLSFMDIQRGSERQFLSFTCESFLFEPSGALITTGSSGVFRWPVETDTNNPQIMRIGPPERLPLPPLGAIVQTPDGGTPAATTSDGAFVWHPDRPADAILLRPHNDCRYAAISADGSLVATGSHNGTGLKVWDAHTGKFIREFLPNRSWTTPFFTTDGCLRNVGGESWRVGEWTECPRDLPGIQVSAPDGKIAAIARSNGVISLIDVASRRELASLEDPHQNVMNALTFSPDGTQLMGVTNDSFCVRVWDLRRIRLGLKELDLDWEAPPFPPVPTTPNKANLLRVQVLGALDANNLAMQLLTGPEAQRNTTKAVRLARQAVALEPNHSAFLNTLGLALYRDGKFKEAIAPLEKSTAVAPGRIDGLNLYVLAMCHVKLGDPVKAKDCFNRAVQWEEKQKKLSAPQVKELQEFRTEAETVMSGLVDPPAPGP